MTPGEIEKTQGFAAPVSTSREKYWTELTDTQKIERCRQVIKQRDWEISDLREGLEETRNLLSSLINHTHSTDGKAVIGFDQFSISRLRADLGRLNKGSHGSIGRPENPNEVYF